MTGTSSDRKVANVEDEKSMQLGLIGLGKMGGNMVRRMTQGGIQVVGFDLNRDAAAELTAATGMLAAESVADLVAQLDGPRTVWLMLPAGDITQAAVDELAELLDRGDTLVDGANSFYRDSVARGKQLAAKSIEFVDAGVSGGVWGLSEGYALMLGGSSGAVDALQPIFKTLAPAPDQGWLHCGPTGAGHFVKMIHNGIEYGMMQAYAEGFALLRSREEFELDLAAIAEMWRHGSVVRSWLLDLTATFLAEDAELADVAPHVADSGEGRWTAIEAIDQGIPSPVMVSALMARFASQGGSEYADKLLAMMRRAFGGHGVKTTD